MKKLFILFFTLVIFLQIYAVPADPKPVTATQPNGEEITLIPMGDEYIHWTETLDGYTLLVNSNFYYCYAQLNASGDLEPSHFVATEIHNRTQEVSEWLQTIDKKLFFSDEQVYYYMQLREINEIEADRSSNRTIGVNKVPILLIQFPDRQYVKTAEDFDMLFNQINYFENGNKGSFKDFFLEASYNKLEVQSSIFGPFTLDYPLDPYYYPESKWWIFAQHSIQKAAAAGVDFSPFTVNGNQIEGIYLIYAGFDQSVLPNSKRIWAHAQLSFNYSYGGFLFKRYAASSELEGNIGSTLSTIGTFCHEYGHVLGAKDYYDTNYQIGGEYEGTGYWDLQASGSHNGYGKRPATPNPRSKIYTYGWATAIELNTPQKCTIPVSRIYDNAYFRINTQEPNQYFLIENKKLDGFDENIPGKNLLIYKCTETYETSTPYPQNTTSWQRFYPVAANAQVAVPEAGTNKQSQYGSINSSTCTWPQTNKTAFNDASIPGMVTWSGASVGKPITNIIAHDDFVTFDFMGGGDKLNFHVFLPAYYGCTITTQPGSISPVNAGGSFAFEVNMLPSHNKSEIKVIANNTTLTPISGNVYVIQNIQADQIVRIEGLKFNIFSITAKAEDNGFIIPDGNIPVNQGGMKSFNIVPTNGYSIKSVIVDGVNKGNIKSYTFNNVQAPHVINATFKPGDLYTINTSDDYFYFETYTDLPSDSVSVTISSPDVISGITVNAPSKFQVSANNGKNWQKAFLIATNKLPFTFHIRFNPENVGEFNEVLQLLSTDAYAEIELTGKALLGINDNVNENTIAIFPNPTTGKLKIESGELGIENVDIFDTFGRKVFEQKTEIKNQIEIDITSLSAGIYLVKIDTDKGVVHKKIVKE
jgi:M6 family metalloprotease-like protein